MLEIQEHTKNYFHSFVKILTETWERYSMEYLLNMQEKV